MIWRLLDALLSRLVGRLLRLSPVDPTDHERWCKERHPGLLCSETVPRD